MDLPLTSSSEEPKVRGRLKELLLPPKEFMPEPEVRFFVIVGLPGSGKTTLALTWAAWVDEAVGADTVLAMKLRSAVEEAKKIFGDSANPVLNIIIDDAPVAFYFAAGRRRTDIELAYELFMIRHYAPRKYRRINVFYITQRLWSLDAMVRSMAAATIFKSLLGDRREEMYIRRVLGAALFRELRSIHYRWLVYKDYSALSKAVYRLSGGARGSFSFTPKRPRFFEDIRYAEAVTEQRNALHDFIMALGVAGITWTRAKFIINHLRSIGYAIQQSKAHELWRQGWIQAHGAPPTRGRPRSEEPETEGI